jgi:uncharacterized repeat protein (TIGR03803 family)
MRLAFVFISASVAANTFSLALPAMAGETLLYSFNSQATGEPHGRPLFEKKSLFGTTEGGSGSYGMVFELHQSGSSWKKTTLFKFNYGNGAYPQAGLIQDSSGALFGTTSTGGAYNGGTVFMLSKSGGGWSETTIWNFGNTGDGAGPACDLVMDSAGAFYGTTQAGGANDDGAVFKLSNSGGVWTETVLYSFAGGTDGIDPYAGVAMDKSGALYGTTYAGGAAGEGTVFALSQSGGVWTETVLHSFGAGSDGQKPGDGPIAINTRGDLYGTTQYGGKNDWGIVFELSPSGTNWKEKLLYNFADGNDGGVPVGGLLLDKAGVLYGTAALGGMNNSGTMFALTGSGGTWSETVLSNFPNHRGDGFNPIAGVIEDTKTGTYYGTTTAGGANGWGTVYAVVP